MRINTNKKVNSNITLERFPLFVKCDDGTQQTSRSFCAWHRGNELAAQHQLKSMWPKEIAGSNRCLQRPSTAASHWRQPGSIMWSLLPSFSYRPFYLFSQLFQLEGEYRVRHLLLKPVPYLPFWYVRLGLMGPGLANGSHWLTGGFDSLAFAEAVNHRLSIATLSQTVGHPFVCSSCVPLWRLTLVVLLQCLCVSNTTIKPQNWPKCLLIVNLKSLLLPRLWEEDSSRLTGWEELHKCAASSDFLLFESQSGLGGQIYSAADTVCVVLSSWDWGGKLLPFKFSSSVEEQAIILL